MRPLSGIESVLVGSGGGGGGGGGGGEGEGGGGVNSEDMEDLDETGEILVSTHCVSVAKCSCGYA